MFAYVYNCLNDSVKALLIAWNSKAFALAGRVEPLTCKGTKKYRDMQVFSDICSYYLPDIQYVKYSMAKL